MVASELLFHASALRYGEDDYPLIVLIDSTNRLIRFPGLHQIHAYINR